MGAACGERGNGSPEPLQPEARALRTSMALRGMRPEVAAVQQIRADPERLEAWVDAWLDTREFGATLRDMHAEQLFLRTDVDEQVPPVGPLAGFTTREVHEGLVEAPLRLIERVVTEGRPYTEIVTADWLLVSHPYAIVHGLPFDPEGESWQETRWGDGRPRAGILSDSELWRRHRSAGSNFHRGRANVVSTVLLCEDFATRDVPVEGGIDLSDELAVAEAVRTQSTCIGCHQAMDPLAGFFWGFRHQLKARAIRTAYDMDCQWPTDDPEPLPGPHGSQDDFCYPLRFYQPELENDWIDWELRAPSYFGTPATDLADVGQLIASDHRFATCTTRRFWSWFAQQPVEDVDTALVDELTAELVGSGFDARALVRAIMLHPQFLAKDGALTTRPEQLARTMADLTEFRWDVQPDGPNCGTECWGSVDLTVSDRYGFRAMAGGIDGITVLTPTHSPTPVRQLALERLASEAAANVVYNDALRDPQERHLLELVSFATSDSEALVRDQIVALHLRISAQVIEPDSPQADQAYALWRKVFDASNDPRRSWTVLVTALLQDDRMEFH